MAMTSRETGTRAEIDPDSRVGGKIQQLERIRDMPGPQVRNRRGATRLVVAAKLSSKLDERVEPLRCFT
jgi:hypothetical protein